MGKKKIISLSVAALCLLLVVGAVLFFLYTGWEEERRQRNRALAAESYHAYQLGETAILDSVEDYKAFDFDGPFASFGWEGTMEFSVSEAKLYSSFQETGLPEEHKSPSIVEGAKKFLCLKVKVKNVDVVKEPESEGFHYISTFTNLQNSKSRSDISYAIGDISYFDGTSSKADSAKGSYAFELERGEEKAFTVGLDVPVEEVDDSLYLGIGTGSLQKYTIDLALDGEVEGKNESPA